MAHHHGMLLLLLGVTSVWTQNIPTVNPNCCGERLMDSGRHIVVEPRKLIEFSPTSTPKQYRAARVKICAGDPFYMQLWKLVDEVNTVFELTWQQYYVGGGFNTIVKFDDIAFIDEDSRFGLYSEGSVSLKFPIPYDINTVGPQTDRILYRTPYPLTDDQISQLTQADAGTQWQLDNLPWPRIFSQNVEWCEFDDCSDTLSPDIPDGGVGPAGPPGPPGPPGQCQSTCELSAEAVDVLLDNLPEEVEDIKEDTTQLKGGVQEVKDLLNNLLNSQTVTGTCPAGFTPGTIGVDGCYAVVRQKVPLAVAHMLCRTQYPGSVLAHIPDQNTENFLKQQVINSFGGGATSDTKEYFWTRGIWSTYDKMWVWYDENTKTKRVMSSYSNWATDEVTDSGINRCLSFNVLYGESDSIWHSEDCHSYRAFICEYPKNCL